MKRVTVKFNRFYILGIYKEKVKERLKDQSCHHS